MLDVTQQVVLFVFVYKNNSFLHFFLYEQPIFMQWKNNNPTSLRTSNNTTTALSLIVHLTIKALIIQNFFATC